jgi:hypothetical protein
MIRLIAIAGFALLLATSAQAMTAAPLHQPTAITNVAFGCGLGRTRIGGIASPEPPSATRGGASGGGDIFALHGTEHLNLQLAYPGRGSSFSRAARGSAFRKASCGPASPA